MTVIAFDGKTLAGDRLRIMRDMPTSARKVWKVKGKDGRRYLVGCAGESDDCVAFVRWLKGGDKPAPTSFDALVVDQKRRLWIVGTKLVYVRVREKCFAIGSGAEFAITAMKLGKPAPDAVRIASRCIISCGRGVNQVSFTRKEVISHGKAKAPARAVRRRQKAKSQGVVAPRAAP